MDPILAGILELIARAKSAEAKVQEQARTIDEQTKRISELEIQVAGTPQLRAVETPKEGV